MDNDMGLGTSKRLDIPPEPRAVRQAPGLATQPNVANRLEDVMRTLQQTRELGNVKNRLVGIQEIAKQIAQTEGFIVSMLPHGLEVTAREQVTAREHLILLRQEFLKQISEYYRELEAK